MRFLHTSDWHIGRTVRGQNRLPEYEESLRQVLMHAREQNVDFVLVAGDVFDTSTPAPESERLVYSFFQELHGAKIPAVVIAGNHDHPQRWDALAMLLTGIDVHVIGAPVARIDATFRLPSRDGKEEAMIAALPWVTERAVVSWDSLQGEMGDPLMEYADKIGRLIAGLSSGFKAETCNILTSHVFVDGAFVGPGGGERALHLEKSIYGVNPQALTPATGRTAQYMALGHVHKNQTVLQSPRAEYSGSLIQMDFGDANQEKFVNVVEIHAGRPVSDKDIDHRPITAGREMVDVGSPEQGVLLTDLAKYAERNDHAWFRVYVDVDMPVPNLPQLVRETLPNAVHVERVNKGSMEPSPDALERRSLEPFELFTRFYRSSFGRRIEPEAEVLTLFNSLLVEEQVLQGEGDE